MAERRSATPPRPSATWGSSRPPPASTWRCACATRASRSRRAWPSTPARRLVGLAPANPSRPPGRWPMRVRGGASGHRKGPKQQGVAAMSDARGGWIRRSVEGSARGAPAAREESGSFLATSSMIEIGCEVEGDLRLEGPVVIHGDFKGSIESSDVVTIGEAGTVQGPIRGRQVLIHGSVVGDVRAIRDVVLNASARLQGGRERGLPGGGARCLLQRPHRDDPAHAHLATGGRGGGRPDRPHEAGEQLGPSCALDGASLSPMGGQGTGVRSGVAARAACLLLLAAIPVRPLRRQPRRLLRRRRLRLPGLLPRPAAALLPGAALEQRVGRRLEGRGLRRRAGPRLPAAREDLAVEGQPRRLGPGALRLPPDVDARLLRPGDRRLPAGGGAPPRQAALRPLGWGGHGRAPDLRGDRPVHHRARRGAGGDVRRVRAAGVRALPPGKRPLLAVPGALRAGAALEGVGLPRRGHRRRLRPRLPPHRPAPPRGLAGARARARPGAPLPPRLLRPALHRLRQLQGRRRGRDALPLARRLPALPPRAARLVPGAVADGPAVAAGDGGPGGAGRRGDALARAARRPARSLPAAAALRGARLVPGRHGHAARHLLHRAAPRHGRDRALPAGLGPPGRRHRALARREATSAGGGAARAGGHGLRAAHLRAGAFLRRRRGRHGARAPGHRRRHRATCPTAAPCT